LDNILCGLDLPTDPKLLAGATTGEDAGVYRLNDETALIQTVDFFTPVVDDPYNFGRIASANALSDVYAMGGKPILAMNLVAFPIKEMDRAILQDVVRGGLDTIKEAGALLVGGHSVEDDEMKYGLSVTGVVHPNRVVLNSGARVGDHLLLTKPVGTGILSTALKGGLAKKITEDMITRVMATLNQEPASLMLTIDPHACTDITGFGLIGHLYEMALASKKAIRIHAKEVPLLPEVLHFASMGIIPEGAYNNRSFYNQFVVNHLEENDPLEMALYDPQTSGGLLVAADLRSVESIAGRLIKRNYPLDFGIIGEVVEGPAGQIQIVG
jgi:selenide,water dikinase